MSRINIPSLEKRKNWEKEGLLAGFWLTRQKEEGAEQEKRGEKSTIVLGPLVICGKFVAVRQSERWKIVRDWFAQV